VLELVIGLTFTGLTRYKGDVGLSPKSQCIEYGTPIYGSKILLVEAKQCLGMPVHPYPTSSPDLNPIENVWKAIKQRIKVYPKLSGTGP
jgi:transposase